MGVHSRLSGEYLRRETCVSRSLREVYSLCAHNTSYEQPEACEMGWLIVNIYFGGNLLGYDIAIGFKSTTR